MIGNQDRQNNLHVHEKPFHDSVFRTREIGKNV